MLVLSWDQIAIFPLCLVERRHGTASAPGGRPPRHLGRLAGRHRRMASPPVAASRLFDEQNDHDRRPPCVKSVKTQLMTTEQHDALLDSSTDLSSDDDCTQLLPRSSATQALDATETDQSPAFVAVAPQSLEPLLLLCPTTPEKMQHPVRSTLVPQVVEVCAQPHLKSPPRLVVLNPLWPSCPQETPPVNQRPVGKRKGEQFKSPLKRPLGRLARPEDAPSIAAEAEAVCPSVSEIMEHEPASDSAPQHRAAVAFTEDTTTTDAVTRLPLDQVAHHLLTAYTRAEAVLKASIPALVRRTCSRRRLVHGAHPCLRKLIE